MFNMKKCEYYNMKTEFEKLRDFDFTVSYVRVVLSNGNRVTKLIPVNQFSLFGIFFLLIINKLLILNIN